MKVLHISCLAFLGICVGLASEAVAEESQDSAEPAKLFQELDKNKDGVVAADEIGEDRAKYFKRLLRVGDQDKDGQLSKEEFVNATKPQETPVEVVSEEAVGGKSNKKKPKGNKQNPGKILKRLDKNKDGVISRDEAEADNLPERLKKRVARLFEKSGKDELTLKDLRALAANNAKKKKKKPADGKGKPGQRLARTFKKLDQDQDGKISVDEVPEEFKPRLVKLLQRAGKEEDGSINLNEFRRVARRDGDAEAPPRRGPAEGGPRRGRGPKFFSKLDTNKDRKLSKEELSRFVEIFEELDENGDGTLDPRELMGAPPRERRRDGDRPRPPRRPEGDVAKRDRPDAPRRGPRFGRGPGLPFREMLGDEGKVSIEKALERIKVRLEKLDTNGDGYIDIEEFRAARIERGAEAFNSRGRRGPGGDRFSSRRRGFGRMRGEGPRRGGEFIKRMIERMDTDEDGKISESEAKGRLKERFKKVDRNGDGFIDAEEMKHARPGRGKGRGKRRPKQDQQKEKEAGAVEGKDA